MTYRLVHRLLLALAVATVMTSTLAAHPGHDHKVMGAVVVVDGHHITMKTTDGKELTFEVTTTTKLVRSKKAGTLADLQPGLRIVANVGDGDEPLHAKEVEYSAAKPATSK